MFKKELYNIINRINSFKGKNNVIVNGIKMKLDRSARSYYAELSEALRYLGTRDQNKVMEKINYIKNKENK